MLGLSLRTDERWAKLAQKNLEELLTDHAYCEQKAASNAISLIVQFPEHSGMVQELTEIAREELEHFGRVHQLIIERGFTFGKERKDNYVNDILAFVRKGMGREVYLADRLLFAAMIEARSCERFKLLSETIGDENLRAFYHELMASEAGHYTTFIKLAKTYTTGIDIDARWKEFLAYENEVIQRYGQSETIHG
jgi:tRNA-(ms[2]io[6]A)-hydroxylase